MEVLGFPVSWGSLAKFTCSLFITQEISTVDPEHIKNRVFIFKSTAPKTGPSIMPGTSAFPSSGTGVSGNFWGHFKGAKYRFALQYGLGSSLDTL